MSFEDQLRLFYHSHLILGQHGAGLNNLMWMNGSDGKVVEIGPHSFNKVFANMSEGKGLTYRTLGEPVKWGKKGDSLGLSCAVDLDELDRLLSGFENEDAFLKNLAK